MPTGDPDIVACVHCRATFAFGESGRRAWRLDAARELPSRAAESPAASQLPPLVATDDDWDDLFEPAAGLLSRRTDRSHRRQSSQAASTEHRPVPDQYPRRRNSSWLQWCVLASGIVMFACGATLIGWSFNADRQSLWNIGAPLALAGQIAFLFGLILQLDLLWQHSDSNARHSVDAGQRPTQPNPAATSFDHLSTTNVVASRPPVAQVDPQRLLSDLKGQLDRVATQLTRPQA